jgi:aryl-alcohol dehydrogenase-like predicted oxidoreductase
MHPVPRCELSADNLRRIDALSAIAEQFSLSLPQLALAWLLREPTVTAVLVGSSSPQQLRSNASALGVRLDQAALDAIDNVCPPQAPDPSRL